MKKIILAILIVGIALGINTFALAKAPTTISFWFLGADRASNEYFMDSAKAFGETHPQIKVEAVVLPSTQADMDLKLNAAILSGTFPDVLSVLISTVGSRGPRGDFYPLDKYIKNWADKNDIYESVYDVGKCNNKIVGLGYNPVPEVLVYRKDFFKEARLDPNHPPTNWDELAKYAKKLTVKDSNNNVIRAGFDIPAVNANAFMKTFFYQNNAAVIDVKKQKPMLNDPAMISALDFVIKLKNENISIPYDYQKKDSIPFVYGRSAMSFLQPTQIAQLLESNPSLKDKIGLAPVLTGKKKTDLCGYRLFAIGNASKHKNEAWEFIKFMMSKNQMRYRYTNLKVPVVRKSMEDEFIAKDPTFNQALIDYVKCGKGDTAVSWNTLAVKYIHLAFEEAYSGKKTPAKALMDAQNNLLKELKSL